MAKNKSTVYLGYDDEEITEKHVNLLNSTVNKIGGNPDWPETSIRVTPCPLCGLIRPLVAQIYAPLERSQFHRTLYIFACLNPICSQTSKGWVCVRTQHLDTPNYPYNENTAKATNAASVNTLPAIKSSKEKKQAKGKTLLSNVNGQYGVQTWCSGSDDWGDDSVNSTTLKIDMETPKTQAEANDEANGNVINFNCLDNSKAEVGGQELLQSNHNEEDDDDSNSMDNDLICSLYKMDMNSLNQLAEDPNANCAAAAVIMPMAGSASIGKDGNYSCSGATASICAEIEMSEVDMVLAEEPPQKPDRDLMAMIRQPTSTAFVSSLKKLSSITLKSFFIAVEVENRAALSRDCENYDAGGSLSVEHIRELYQEYKRRDETLTNYSPQAGDQPGGFASGASRCDDQETYENTLPAHGDLMFHNFLRTVQHNPGQIIRYSRDALPLLIAPIQEAIPKCPNCNGDTICEVQLLPTLIPKLRIQQRQDTVTPIEFGNVLVFTCLKSCWDTPDKMRYERIIVQSEK